MLASMTSMTPPQFGEEGRRLSYGSYLRIPELLDLQAPQADPVAHDELLFIVVHQVYELWFKQLLFELDSIVAAMTSGDAARARHLFARVHAIERVLVEHVDVLETMTPRDFLEFRTNLAPASGFQSVQFREIEFLSGLKDPRMLRRLDPVPEEAERLQRRLDAPTVWDAFCALLATRGLAVGTVDERRESLLVVARDRSEHGAVWDVAEGLVTHDELMGQWRARHVDMVERQIGTKSGTGGSTGGPYLRSRLGVRFFPELWELRSYL